MKQKQSTQGKSLRQPSSLSSKTFKGYPTEQFIREAIVLKKKYPAIGKDFRALLKLLKTQPCEIGVSLGHDCFKIRMRISDKGKGVSGGARVIIQVKVISRDVFVLAVYDKSEKSNMSEHELLRCLSDMLVRYRDSST